MFLVVEQPGPNNEDDEDNDDGDDDEDRVDVADDDDWDSLIVGAFVGDR